MVRLMNSADIVGIVFAILIVLLLLVVFSVDNTRMKMFLVNIVGMNNNSCE